jgi:hypothetical protein
VASGVCVLQPVTTNMALIPIAISRFPNIITLRGALLSCAIELQRIAHASRLQN